MAKKTDVVLDLDSAMDDDLENSNLATFSMRTKLKTPEFTAALPIQKYKKILKDMLDELLQNSSLKAPFFFVTNFEFGAPDDDAELAALGKEMPLFFIGKLSTPWKMAIKQDYRKRKQFASGTCMVSPDGSQLFLTVNAGKGQNTLNLNLLNKRLFKKLNLTASWGIASASPADDSKDEVESKEEKDLTAKGEKFSSKSKDIEHFDEGSIFRRIQLEIEAYRAQAPTDAQARSNNLYRLQTLVHEWEINFAKHTNERPEEAEFIKKFKKEFLTKAVGQNTAIMAQRELKEFVVEYRSARAEGNKLLGDLKNWTKPYEEIKIDELRWASQAYLTLAQSVAEWIHNYSSNKQNVLVSSNLQAEAEKLRLAVAKDTKNFGEQILKQCKFDIRSVEPYRYRQTNNYDAEELRIYKNAMALSPSDEVNAAFNKFFKTSEFKEVQRLYNEFNSIPIADLEACRLHLLKLSAAVRMWEGLEKKGDTEQKAITSISKNLFARIQLLGEFEQKNDNYLEILDLHSEIMSHIKPKIVDNEKLSVILETLLARFDEMVEKWASVHLSMSEIETEQRFKKLAELQRELHDTIAALNIGVEDNDINKSLNNKAIYNPNSDIVFPKMQKLVDEKFANAFRTSDVKKLSQLVTEWEYLTAFVGSDSNGTLDARRKEVEQWKNKYISVGKFLLQAKSDAPALDKKCQSLNKKIAKLADIQANSKKSASDKAKAKNKQMELEQQYLAYWQQLEAIRAEYQKQLNPSSDDQSKPNGAAQTDSVLSRFKSKNKAVLEQAPEGALPQKYKDYITEKSSGFEAIKKTMLDALDTNAIDADLMQKIGTQIAEWEKIPALQSDEIAAQNNQLRQLGEAMAIASQQTATNELPDAQLLAALEKQFNAFMLYADDAKNRAAVGQLFLDMSANWLEKNNNLYVPSIKAQAQELTRQRHVVESRMATTLAIESENAEIESCLEGLFQHQRFSHESLRSQGFNPIPKTFVEMQNSLIEAVRQNIKTLPANEKRRKAASELLAATKNSLDEMEREFIADEVKKARAEEQKALSAFGGYNVYANFENVTMSEDERAKYQAIVDKATERVRRLREVGASHDECRRAMEHIPIAFWDDDLIDEFRMWKEVDAELSSPILQSNKGKGLQKANSAADTASAAVAQFADMWNEVAAANNFVYTPALNEGGANASISQFGLNNTDAAYTQDSNAGALAGNIATGFLGATGVIDSAVNTKNLIAAIRANQKEAIDTKEKAAFVAKKITNFVAIELSKYSKLALSAVETNGEFTDDGVKGARTALKGLAFICDSAARITSGDAVSLKNFRDNWQEHTETIVDLFISAGATAGDIASVFVPVGGIISSTFELVGDIKALVVDLIKVAKKRAKLNKTNGFLRSAAQAGSSSLFALRRQSKVAKKQRNNAIIDASLSLGNIAGSTTKLVGAVATSGATASGVGALGAAGGLVISMSGQIFKSLIKFTGKGIRLGQFIGDEMAKKKVENLLILARKGDRKAKRLILEQSSMYAKMFLIIGATKKDSSGELNPDPIARQYILQMGISESDLDNELEGRSIVLKYMQQADDESPEGISIWSSRNKQYYDEFKKGVLVVTPQMIEQWIARGVVEEKMHLEIKRYNEILSTGFSNRILTRDWSMSELREYQRTNLLNIMEHIQKLLPTKAQEIKDTEQAIVSQSAAIDGKNTPQILQEIRVLNQKIQTLRSDIDFYNGILTQLQHV